MKLQSIVKKWNITEHISPSDSLCQHWCLKSQLDLNMLDWDSWTCWIEILWAYLKLEKYSSLIERLTTSKLKTHFVSIGVHSLSLTWTCWIEILWAYLKLEKYSSLIERLTTSKLKTHTKFRRYPTQSLLLPKLA